MIKAESEDKKIECCITGYGNDILNEFSTILEALSRHKELMIPMVIIIEDFIDEQIKENNKIPDCFRPDPDTINDLLKNILKEKKEND